MPGRGRSLVHGTLRAAVAVVCVGYAYHRPWRAHSWDRFAVPRPFSRGRAVFGPPLRVPAALDRADLQYYCAWFGKLLNWLTDEAEQWAADGESRPGEVRLRPGYGAHGPHATDPTAPPLPDSLSDEWAELAGASLIAA